MRPTKVETQQEDSSSDRPSPEAAVAQAQENHGIMTQVLHAMTKTYHIGPMTHQTVKRTAHSLSIVYDFTYGHADSVEAGEVARMLQYTLEQLEWPFSAPSVEVASSFRKTYEVRYTW